MNRWAVVLLLFPIVARADDSAISGIGGNIKMLRGHRSIRMVSEDVRVRLPDATLRAVFVFRNDGPATTVKIGFPETGSGDVSKPKHSEFGYFRSYVDGERVKVRREGARTDSDGDYHIWWTKTVSFGPRQTRVIVNEYQGGIGGSTDNHAFFTYVLATGASWKGPIGHARITVDASGLGRVSDLRFEGGERRSGGRIVWTFDDLDPTEDDDIHLSWWNGFKDIWVNGNPVYDAGHSWFANRDQGNTPPKCVGKDVILPLRAAASFLGCQIQDGENGATRISGPIRWLDVRRGSRTMWSGPRTYGFHHAPYLHRDENGASLIVELRPLVQALGGKSWWAKDGLHVKLPK